MEIKTTELCLRQIRRILCLNADFICEQLGVCRRTYYAYELGTKTLGKLQIEKLSQIYNVPLEEMKLVAANTFKGGKN
jgi:transcriptional regulator with XRE-family HTH domain